MKPVENVGPRHHYLRQVEVASEEKRVRAVLIFPSEDPSIGDRVDHVNIAHLEFGAWNAAHHLLKQLGLKNPLTTKGSYNCKRKTPPDTPVNLDLSINKSTERVDGKIQGQFNVRYTNQEGKELASLHGEFVAEK